MWGEAHRQVADGGAVGSVGRSAGVCDEARVRVPVGVPLAPAAVLQGQPGAG